jgi:hypothetical protein
MTNPFSTPLEEELNQLEVLIRQLKQQYDIFFAGAAKRQPFETRKEVSTIINRLGGLRMQRFSDRYRYNALANRFQTYCELWAKTMRMREEGFRPGGTRAAEPPPPSPRQGSATPADSVTYRSRFRDPTSEDDSFKTFYDKYIEARHSRSEGANPVGYSSFLKAIAQKTESIKSKSGCSQVAYSIVVRKDGTVALKAAPVKEKKR